MISEAVKATPGVQCTSLQGKPYVSNLVDIQLLKLPL